MQIKIKEATINTIEEEKEVLEETEEEDALRKQILSSVSSVF